MFSWKLLYNYIIRNPACQINVKVCKLEEILYDDCWILLLLWDRSIYKQTWAQRWWQTWVQTRNIPWPFMPSTPVSSETPQLSPCRRVGFALFDTCSCSCASTVLCLSAPLPQVSNFRVIEEGLFSLRLGWTSPPGKINGFNILIPKCMLKWCSYNPTD